MNANTFIGLLDTAIAVAEKVASEAVGTGQAWMVEDAQNAAEQFHRIRVEVVSGQLPPSGGAGLGITRALSEWAPPELYAAGKAVEDYYSRN